MEEFIERVHRLIDQCWESFTEKVGNGLIEINKEASMQLQYAYLLKNSLDLYLFNADESIKIELESGIPINGRLRECDLQIHIIKDSNKCILPIEMKCYKTLSASGKPRGAQDLFKFGVYEDLELLESYESETENRMLGIELVMTDHINFAFPKTKNGKSWDYDISDGNIINNGITLNTPIGGVPKTLVLNYNYKFNWINKGEYFFMKLKGTKTLIK
ncbi:hypothetical protein [Aestuariivivens sp. NBU2969]|uniref:hypothetical protein n=1 Tax=Aestuariivivens sp. NBU2969 TaxID=2873267 RepID=UPI001CBFA598|nr:hypothetical protein [Aestuariivivens sp. NBU2969]